MTFQENIPIYIQISNDIKEQIVAGELQEGDKLPSIREYSVKYSVTALTMQRAMALLETDKIVQTKKGVGSFVMTDIKEMLKNTILAEQVKNFIDQLIKMGLKKEEILELVKEELANG